MHRLLATFFAIVSLFATMIVPAAAPMGLTGSSTNDYFLNLNTIGQIGCIKFPPGVTAQTDPATLNMFQMLQMKRGSGTGTIIARNRVLTAAHVIEGFDMCVFKGKTLRVVYTNDHLDTAVLVADLGDTPVTPINCDGLAKGEYLGFGFARGTDFAVQRFAFGGDYRDQPLAGGGIARHQALVGGAAYPGMSGGPVVNGAGEVVAIINTGGPGVGGIRDLTETPLCAALNWNGTPQP